MIADDDVLPRVQAVVVPAIVVVEIGVAGFDRQLAAVGHGVARVEREIEDAGLELRRVDLDGPQAGAADRLELDGLAERAHQKVGHADDELVGVDRARVERLPAREGEQPLRQLRGALGAGQGVVERALGARFDHPALRDVEVADDDGEQVVEVVRHAAGQLADRLHLLRLPQRLLGELAPRHLGVEGLRAPQGQQHQREQKESRRRAEEQVGRERPQPVGVDIPQLDAGGRIEARHIQLAHADAPVDAVDRLARGGDAALRVVGENVHESALRIDPGDGRRRIAAEDIAVGLEDDIVAAVVVGEARVKLGEDAGLDRDDDDARELSVLQRPAATDADVGPGGETRLEHRSDEGAGVLAHLRLEEVAVGDVLVRREPAEPAELTTGRPFLSNILMALTAVVAFSSSCSLACRLGVRCPDLLVGHAADDRIDAGEIERDGFEDRIGLLGQDVQPRPQFLVGMREGVVVGDPAAPAEAWRPESRSRRPTRPATGGRPCPDALAWNSFVAPRPE